MIRVFASRLGRLLLGIWVMMLVTSVTGLNLVTVASTQRNPSCTVTPSTVVLDQSFTVTAVGLPSGSPVNLVRTYPNGTMEIMLISISANGTFTLTQSSADSVLPSEQIGTYTYKFVGKVKWPGGTYSRIYASCSVNVT